MTTENTCGYSLDGEHHFGERSWGARGAERVVVACRCGVVATDGEKRAMKDAESLTTKEQRRQRDVSRAMLKKIAGTGEQPKLPL